MHLKSVQAVLQVVDFLYSYSCADDNIVLLLLSTVTYNSVIKLWNVNYPCQIEKCEICINSGAHVLFMSSQAVCENIFVLKLPPWNSQNFHFIQFEV
jgi:hypothetical protein